MTDRIADISLRRISRFTGIGYLIIFITGFFSNFFVLENLVFPGNAASTAASISSGIFLFRAGIFGFFIMVICDVLLAWTLYVLLKPVNKDLSLLSGWLRLVNGTIFGVALYNLLDIAKLVSNSEYLNIITTGERNARVMLSLDTFNHTWLIGLVFFGLHLLMLGYLIIKSGYIPKFIGVLLIIAALGYMIDSFANFLLSNYSDYKNIFMLIVVIPGIVGELSFTIWLLFKGVKIRHL